MGQRLHQQGPGQGRRAPAAAAADRRAGGRADAGDGEELHDENAFWQGRDDAGRHAISGIDIALWDIFGKICGQPVARLLGGYYRNKIKPYGSILFDEPGPLRGREVTTRTVAAGFKAITLSLASVRRMDATAGPTEVLMKTAREANGPGVGLMVDAGGSGADSGQHGYKWAAWKPLEMLADFDVVWFEEALPPDDLEGFIELRRHAPVKIATGEVLTRRQSFRPFKPKQHAADVVQPDATDVRLA